MNLSGSPLDYLAVFIGGVFLSFTPCVYPLIPISIGVIGVNAEGKKIKGLLLSLVYVTGVAVTYSFLGLLASLTGQIFGRISSSPVSYIVLGAVVLLFGISMLDVFRISLPLPGKLLQVRKRSMLSVFVVGLVSGFAVSPCVTPVLGAILAYISTKRNVLYSMSLLFSFAYGMGLVLVLAGTFSSVLVNLPKSGKWMLYVKRAYALILTIVGVYFIYSGIRRI